MFLTTKIFINYSDHEDINPFTSTKIYLFSRTVMGNFQHSFIVYMKMFLELVQCVILPNYSAVYSMHGSRFDKNDVYLSTCVCLKGNQARYNSHDNGACAASLPKCLHLEGHRYPKAQQTHSYSVWDYTIGYFGKLIFSFNLKKIYS